MNDPDLLTLLARERNVDIAQTMSHLRGESRTGRWTACCKVGAAEVVAAWRRSFALTVAFLTGTPAG
ncbi:hypothetical protein [Vulcanimicrobium alpinum]|nr:hypothetical protein [Vulcanimicrobium alpinum]